MRAVDQALLSGAKITLVHVHDSPRFGFAEVPMLLGATEDALLDMEKNEMGLLVEKIRARGVEADFLIRKGRPAPTIVAAAKEVGADLVVLGTHGRKLVERAFLGSVAERVVRTSSVAVLVVPPPNAELAS